MRYATLFGVVFGFMLAVGALWGGVTGFLLVAVLCGVGGLIGAHLEGLVDLRAVFSSGHRGRG